MRVPRALVAVLVALVSGLGLAILAAPAQAAKVQGRVSLDPQYGPPDTIITVQFQQVTSGDPGCGSFPVVFKWDGHPVGGGKLKNCVVIDSFQPPHGAAKAGPHRVIATDDKNTVLSQPVFFIIFTGDPSGSPTRNPSSPSI